MPDISPAKALTANVAEQIADAESRLRLDFAKQARLPWDSLHDVVGPLWPGDFWVIAASTGHGKTTALMNLVREWALEHRRVWVLPLEQSAGRMRLYWAAFELELHPTIVLENRLSQVERQRVKDHLAWQRGPGRELIGFSDDEVLTPSGVFTAYEEAVRFGAQILVIDHLSHMAPDRSGGQRYDALTEICQGIVALGKDTACTGLVTIAAAQLGRDREGDILAPFLPPKETAIQGGEVIRQTCHVALGLYRPLRSTFEKGDALAVRHGQSDLKQYLEPNTIGVRVLKHRVRGDAFGQIVKLGFEKGRITCPHTTERLNFETRNDL